MNLDEKIIYQIYPKSFKDSNNDGVGDIRGIIEKLDYLEDLGIDMIWLNPMYISPQNDNGYDIEDYYRIDPRFGSMNDLEELIQKASERGIFLMFDMVLNHTSTEHIWFKKAKEDDPYYKDFYYIRKKPNNWKSKFGGSAWEKLNDNQYYLHLYDRTQADVNWHNPHLRKELYNIVNFWLDKGIKGLRFDVLNVIGKDQSLEDSDGNIDHEKKLYTDTEIVHDFIKELNNKTYSKYDDIITVGEMSSTSIENSIRYTDPKNNELDMVFSFHHLKVDYRDGDKWTDQRFSFEKLKHILFNWQKNLSKNGQMALFWNNHDQPRANDRFGDMDNYPYETSTMLATVMQLLKGTVYIYQGEEIGMRNPGFTSIEQYDDIETKNAYNELIDKVDHDKAIKILQEKSRDNSRTVMQWDNSKYSGFSKHKPWISTTNYKDINVKNDLNSQKSIFKYYKNLIALRKSSKIIQKGDFTPILEDDKSIFAYKREYEGKNIFVIANFYDKDILIDLKKLNINGKKLIGNYKKDLKQNYNLESYEVIVIEED